MSSFFGTRLGTAPCRSRYPAIFAAIRVAAVVAIAAWLALIISAPPLGYGDSRISVPTLHHYIGSDWFDTAMLFRAGLALLCATGAALVAGCLAWGNTPLSDCAVVMPHADDPRMHRGEYASRDLNHRLAQDFGPTCEKGLWLAPQVRLPREAESKFLLVVGDKGSGKSNLVRALASQAIARRDRVLLHCVKGDVTQSFDDDEVILIGAHHAAGWAWDVSADVTDEGAYMDLATAVIPASGNSAFWAQSARAVFVDILEDLASEGNYWTFMDLAERLLDDPAAIRLRIERLVLSSGLLIETGPDGPTATTFGVLATLWAAALTGIRPLALAWADTPPYRRFSVKRWLRGGERRTVILQTNPDRQELSTLVSTALLTRIVDGVSDSSLPPDPTRRITLALDEFHALGRIPRIETVLALGRDKGLVVIAALQSLTQLPAVYGKDVGQVVQDLFRVRIFSGLAAGASADLASDLMGRRTLVWRERNNDPNVKGLYKDERGERPVVSPTTLQKELGVRQVGKDPKNPEHKAVRAVVSGFGDVQQFDWPLTIWPKRREGYAPAAWLTTSRLRDRLAETPSANGG